MKTANRFDTYGAGAVERLDNGFLRVPVFATRAGIFNYRLPDGTVRRELRHPDEVFKADSLKSMRSIPVTNKHPSELVDSKNVRKHLVGTTSDQINRTDDFIETAVTLMDQSIIDKVDSEGVRQVSCGYKCDVVHEPGTFNGECYDAVQKNIKYNHLALVSHGRAGPDVKLRMDSDDAELVLDGGSPPNIRPDIKPNRGDSVMTKVKIGGVNYEASESLAGAVTAELQKRDEAAATAKTKLDEAIAAAKTAEDVAKAKTDQLETDNAKLKKDAEERPEVKDAVKARMSLVGKATPHLDKETVAKLDDMDDADVKVAVIKSVAEKFDAEGKSADYIDARFDAIIETAPEPKKTDKSNTLIRGVSKVDSDRQEGDKTPEQIRVDAQRRDEQAWDKPLSHSTRAAGGAK